MTEHPVLPHTIPHTISRNTTSLNQQVAKARVELHRKIDRVLDTLEQHYASTSQPVEAYANIASPRDIQVRASCSIDTTVLSDGENFRDKPTSESLSRKQKRRFMPHMAVSRIGSITRRTTRTSDASSKGFLGEGSVFLKEALSQKRARLASTIFGGKVIRENGKFSQREAQPVFADAAQMKEKVRNACIQKPYSVMDYYRREGLAQRIARSPYFEFLTLFVISFNAIWIAIDLDNNDEDLLLDADPVFQIAENSFCIYFTVELLVRFLAFRKTRDCFRDWWFCFDLALVVVMVSETWIMTLILFLSGTTADSNLGSTSVLKVLRLARLTRMARMAKVLRAVPELIILIKGIWVAARSVFFTLILLLLMLYIFAVVFVQTTKGSAIGDFYYDSVPSAMASLLLYSVLPDQATMIKHNADVNLGLGCLSLCFVLLASLTVMNMLIGVLCEVVKIVSAVEKEQLTVSYVKHQLLRLLGIKVDDSTKGISKHEFEELLTNANAAKIISELGVDVVGLLDFGEIIYTDNNELPFAGFIELILQMRGTNHSTVKDIVDLRKFISLELHQIEELLYKAFAIRDSSSETNKSTPVSSPTRVVKAANREAWT